MCWSPQGNPSVAFPHSVSQCMFLEKTLGGCFLTFKEEKMSWRGPLASSQQMTSRSRTERAGRDSWQASHAEGTAKDTW